MKIADRILELCNEKGISANKLAALSDMTQSTLADIVKGKNVSPRVSTIEKICSGLEITLADFFTYESDNIALDTNIKESNSTEVNKKDVGQRIVQIKQQKGLSQYKLSKLAGISQATLSDIEANKKSPTITTLEKICNALEISLSDFFLEDKKPDDDELQSLPADAKKELDLFKEFLFYKHGIKKPVIDK